MPGWQLKAGVAAAAVVGAAVFALQDGSGEVGTWGLKGSADDAYAPVCVDVGDASAVGTWTGRCMKGVPDGEGVLSGREDGATMEGSFVDGKQDGRWTLRPGDALSDRMGVPKGLAIDMCFRAGKEVECGAKTADSPSAETCARYAEADHAFEVANREAKATYDADLKASKLAYDATMSGPKDDLHTATQEAEAAHRRAKQEAGDVSNVKQAEALAVVKTMPRGPERDKALNAAVANEEARAVYVAAVKESEAVREDALKAARTAYDAVDREAKAAHTRAFATVLGAYRTAVQNAEVARDDAYLEIYEDSAGVRSDAPAVMAKLLKVHRRQCRALYDL